MINSADKFWGLARAGRWDQIRYWLWSYWAGLDFSKVTVERRALSYVWSGQSSGSGGPVLLDVLEHLEIPPGCSIIDIGSGKGAAMITLLESEKFEEVCGVEVSTDMVRIAERNLNKLGLKRWRLWAGDASYFSDELDAFNFIYMFNPFPATVMRYFLHNLRQSLTRNSRWLDLIYANPECDEDLVASELFDDVEEFRPLGAPVPIKLYRRWNHG